MINHIKNFIRLRNEIKELEFGDVLLCYKDTSISGKYEDKPAKLISKFTGSSYTHAAIYIGNGMVFEAVPMKLRKVKIKKLLDQYTYIAVIRSLFWEETGSKLAKDFNNALLEKSTWYNCVGAGMSLYHRVATKRDLIKNLNDYFENGKAPTKSNSYFCSQLVCEIFIQAGYIHESASVLLNPKAFTPIDLLNEPAYGLFLKYIKPNENVVIPTNDPLKNHTKHPAVKI